MIAGNASNRVFWFGMHKLLTKTELPRLRQLGFEVFNPPYLSSVYDQSANTAQDWKQHTTLPPEVFKKLMNHNFFYSLLPADIAELLNEYFATVIVTINMHWLRPILANFKGKIIYRVYGQHFRVSDEFVSAGLWHAVMSRENLYIVPFATESIEREHTWFIEKCTDIVPYHLDEDIIPHRDTWSGIAHRQEIMVTMPNIDNAYFESHYRIFNDRFPHSFYKLYGVQRSNKKDPRVVGTLDRPELIRRFKQAAGYYYHFRDQVCYLPPIEMMEIGGPVLYAPDSLLAQFYTVDSPGLCRSIFETDVAVRRLLDGDKVFIQELQSAQQPVRDRYRPETVNPVFDRVFTRLLNNDSTLPPAIYSLGKSGIIGTLSNDIQDRVLVIAFHYNGLLRRGKTGKVFAFEGIPRVVDAIVDAVVAHTDVHVVVTCRAAVADALFDFFADKVRQGRLSLRVLDPEGLKPVHAPDLSSTEAGAVDRSSIIGRADSDDMLIRLAYAAFCDSLPPRAAQIVPHFYLFPEAALVDVPMMLYLPDYYHHLMPDVVFDSSVEKDRENEKIGSMLVKRAALVLTNSEYTASYLPDSTLFGGEGSEKIRMLWLPLLGKARGVLLGADEQAALEAQIGGGPYIFYPTANRPNKQIAFLLHVLALVREEYPSLMLVLTGDLTSVAAAGEAADQFDLRRNVVLLSQVSESELRWLYENTAALCLTSTIEGNFPPQIREALSYGAPVVATRLPMIVEVLGEHADQLLLCRALDLDDFASAIKIAIEDRDAVLSRQAVALRTLTQVSTDSQFGEGIAALVEELVGRKPISGKKSVSIVEN